MSGSSSKDKSISDIERNKAVDKLSKIIDGVLKDGSTNTLKSKLGEIVDHIIKAAAYEAEVARLKAEEARDNEPDQLGKLITSD